jgi:multidrug efflux pump subunit AcrA (membrane-fusion protein)
MSDQHPIVEALAKAERAYTRARQAAARAKVERDRLKTERNSAILAEDPKVEHTKVADKFDVAEGTVRSIRNKAWGDTP